MKISLKTKLKYFLLFCAICLLCDSSVLGKFPPSAQVKINFWNKPPKKGANIFNRSINSQNIRAAKKYGIQFIRLVPDKFKSRHRDFLIGNADNYQGLVKEDLEHLKRILDLCSQEKMPVIISMLSLPGSRWRQNNNAKDDLRIWKEEKFRTQAASFWKELAYALKDHPAIIGYNIINEPHPEKIYDAKGLQIYEICQEKIQDMLFNFYQLIIKNIRSVDPLTPIVLDSSAYGDSNTFRHLKPHKDPNIIYSFHIYEPYEYTTKKLNQGELCYPGNIGGKYWDKKELYRYMEPVIKFQKSYKIPASRIFVGEFGAHRMSPGIDQYFKDLTSIFNQQGWHFAFYAFREDTWDGMDYELGKMASGYWKTIESGKEPRRDGNTPTFLVLRNALRSQ